MNQFELWAMLVIVAAASAAGGFCVGLEDEFPGCPEIDTDAQMILLMDECERCKDGEAKNWEDAAAKRRDELEECVEDYRLCREEEADCPMLTQPVWR